MNKNIITVERAASRGMTVTISGGVQECMEAIGNVIAAAVANMADSGTPEEAIHQQMGICMAYGLQHGMRRAKTRQATTERVEIGYTVDKERWNEAAENMERAAGPMAAYLLQLNGDGMGQEDADDFIRRGPGSYRRPIRRGVRSGQVPVYPRKGETEGKGGLNHEQNQN